MAHQTATCLLQARQAACNRRLMQGAVSSTDVHFMVLRVLARLGLDALAAREAKRITNLATAASKVAAEQIMLAILACMKTWAGPDHLGQAAYLGNCLHNRDTSEAGLSWPRLSGTPLCCHLQVALCYKPLPDLDSLVSQLALSKQLVKEISPKRLTVSPAPLCGTAMCLIACNIRRHLASPEHHRCCFAPLALARARCTHTVAGRAPSQHVVLLSDGAGFVTGAVCLRNQLTTNVLLRRAWPTLSSLTCARSTLVGLSPGERRGTPYMQLRDFVKGTQISFLFTSGAMACPTGGEILLLCSSDAGRTVRAQAVSRERRWAVCALVLLSLYFLVHTYSNASQSPALLYSTALQDAGC